ncbi:MAG: type II toxin-antitoxin system VapC family toxin [Candidatus Binataceae bacterium]
MVLDASVTLAWCFEDERDDYAAAILMQLVAGDEAIAPAMWPYEVVNALVVGERRGRISPAEAALFVERLANYPIVVEPPATPPNWTALLDLARTTKLSAYDAAYLELALREQLSLVTLDTRLRAAARKAGLSVALPR